MINIKNYWAGYNNTYFIKNIDLAIQNGDILGIIGTNGAGKSTFFNGIMGLIDAKGSINVNNTNILNLKTELIAHYNIAYVRQYENIFSDLSVIENLDLANSVLSKSVPDEIVTRVFREFDFLIKKSNMPASNLSGGEQKLLAIACCLITHPDIILIDEPSLGLSEYRLNNVIKLLTEINNKFNTTIVIAEHRLNTVLNLCKNIIGLKLGEVIFTGKPEEIHNNKKILEKIYF